MGAIKKFLSTHHTMILDGAFATELEARGVDLRDPLWSAKVLYENPDLIRAVHLDYFRAGANCATSASYQASVPGFVQKGFTQQQALGLMRRSVTLAQEAREAFCNETKTPQPWPLVAASVGPYGAYLADGSEYRGDYKISDAALYDFHAPRLDALLDAKPDIIACETIPCIQEAVVLAQMLQARNVPSAWISFSAKDAKHISSGETLREAVLAVQNVQGLGSPWLEAIGINCTAPEHILGLIAEIRSESNVAIVVYPNSGEHYDATHKTWGGTPENHCVVFANQGTEWVAAGARLVGGCCRTTPAHIEALSGLHTTNRVN